MNTTTLTREIKLDDYKRIVAKITRGDVSQKVIKFLGGEPTLHSRLFELLNIALEKGLSVQMFTNGIIEDEKVQKLALLGKKIGYTFNISTPGFQKNKRLQAKIIKNIKLLANKSKITLSVTLDYHFNSKSFFSALDPAVLRHVDNIRIGFSNPIAGTRNWYPFESFPKMGSILINFIKTAKKNGFTGKFSMNCGFTRCMFSQKQFEYVKSQTDFKGWGCFGKGSSMDITVDLFAFHCFPLANHRRVSLQKKSYSQVNKIFTKERMSLWSKYEGKTCLKCPFYGYGGEKCPGPCLAFRINGYKG